jgi:hypothetical protein
MPATVDLFGPIDCQGHKRADDVVAAVYFGFDAGIITDSSA